MKQVALWCKTKRKFKVTTDSGHSNPIASTHLNREFTVHHADQCYVGDINYIWIQAGWLYLVPERKLNCF
jgi:transposase InsO family protein